MKLIFRNWTTTMGLAVTEKFRLEPNNYLDMQEYLNGLSSGGRKRNRKSKKNKRKSKKNKRKSIKRRK